MILSSVCVLVALLATEPMAPTVRTRYPYWQMVEEVVTQIEAQPPRTLSIDQGLRTPGQEYAFEAFRHLRTTDLVRAAKEGVQVARTEAALGKSPAEVDQQALRNVTIALEYLPLLVRDDKDIDELLIIARSREEDLVLRRYLLERMAYGNGPPTLLSEGLSLILRSRDEQFRDTLTQIASHPGENPAMQVLAIDVIMDYLLSQYDAVFQNDPKVRTLADSGEQVGFAAAVDEEALTLSPETLAQLRRLGLQMSVFAGAIAGHIAEGSVRDARVQERTRKALELMRDSIIGIRRDDVILYLEGQAPERQPDFPVLPTMPDMPLDMPMSMPGEMTPIPLPVDGGPPSFEEFGF